MSHTYSVVIAAYNAEKTLEACLASVIAQTLPPLEVLIVDDNSSDGTAGAVERSECRFVAAGILLKHFRLTRNSGPSGARNKGIREASGDYIAFLDADDVWASDKLAIVNRYVSGSNAGLIYHGYTSERWLHDASNDDHYESEPVLICGMLLRNPAQTSCAVVRNQPLLAFDEAMRYCEDYDLWMRIAERAPVLRLAGSPLACLGRPQLSVGGLSGNTVQMRAGEMRVYWKFCWRSWHRRIWILPALLLFSLLKHAYSWLCRSLR